MRASIIFLYVMGFIEGGACLSERQNTTSQEEPSLDQSDVLHLLKELMLGPLLGRRVTLLLQETLLSSFDPDGLIEGLDQPVYLLRLPQESQEIEVNIFNDNDTSFVNSSDYTNSYNYPLAHSVLVIVLEPSSAHWWPLQFPVSHWNPEALLLIGTSPPCTAKKYLKTPLLTKPSYLSVICPYERSSPPYTLDFKVWTWKPFSSGSRLVDLGSWNLDSFQTWDRLFIDRFRDMRRKNMTIFAQAEDRPLIYITPEGVLKGFSYIIMDTLRWWLEFDLRYETGINILWTTILDTIRKGENDVFINYATITPKRNVDFDFTVPYHREGFAIMLENPPPLPRWQSILFAFSWWVWTAILISTIFSAITYHLLGLHYDLPFASNVILILQSLLSKPLDKVPAVWRLRNFLLVWWIFAWFVTLSYTCNLTAVLTVPVFPKKIQTAEELVNSDYRLCMLDYGEFVDEALAASTHPVLSRLYKILDMVPSRDDLEHTGEEQCMELVLAGTHAHTETYSYVKILYSKLGYGAKVYSLRDQLYSGYLVFLIKKHAPWKYKFDTGMQWMFENGLIQKWYKDSMDEFKGYFETKPTPELLPLSLGHLQGPFLLYLIGLFLASLSMLWEVVIPPKEK